MQVTRRFRSDSLNNSATLAKETYTGIAVKLKSTSIAQYRCPVEPESDLH